MFRYGLPSDRACQDFVAGSHNVVLRQQDQVFLRKPEIVSPSKLWYTAVAAIHTHCYLAAPFDRRCETAAKSHPEREISSTYLFTRLNNSFKALNLLLVFLLLQLERQRTWTEFSWKAKPENYWRTLYHRLLDEALCCKSICDNATKDWNSSDNEKQLHLGKNLLREET